MKSLGRERSLKGGPAKAQRVAAGSATDNDVRVVSEDVGFPLT